MLNRQDLEQLGEEIRDVIEKRGIHFERFVITMAVSRQAYEQIMTSLGKSDSVFTFSVSNSNWLIQINRPFMD